MKIDSHIYKITDLRNNMTIIGKHNGKIRSYFTSSQIIKNILKKHGKEKAKDFLKKEIIIQGNFNPALLNELEKHYIRLYNTKYPYGYNLTDGGEGTSGILFDEKRRIKISEQMRLLWSDLEFRNKMKPISKEIGRKNGDRLRGTKRSYETTEKQLEYIKNIKPKFGKENGNFGNKWSDAQKMRLSSLRKENIKNGLVVPLRGDKTYAYGKPSNHRRGVIRLDSNGGMTEYVSVTEAAKLNNLTPGMIVSYCKKHKKPNNKIYSFEYL